MQRLARLALVITAACGGGTPTGEATLTSNQTTIARAAAAETFTDADAGGNQVMGWTILFYDGDPGGDCLEGTVAAKIGIFTNQAAGSAPQALLQSGGISIVADSPPVVAGQAAATMGVEGVSNVVGQINIVDFHLTPDAMHADFIRGTVVAGGYDANQAGVSLNGEFMAPTCTEK